MIQFAKDALAIGVMMLVAWGVMMLVAWGVILAAAGSVAGLLTLIYKAVFSWRGM